MAEENGNDVRRRPELDAIHAAPVGVRVAGLAALAFLLACAHGTLEEPPKDARERRQAEMDACYRRALPAWLDDGALASAARLDQLEGDASRANDSFRGGAFTSQPPASRRGPRVGAILEERRLFLERCAMLRASGKGPIHL